MPSRPRVALVTCAAQPRLYAEEHELLAALGAEGVDAEPVLWNDPVADWRSFDAVVLRSTWDYFERYAEFCAWLSRLEREGVRVANPVSLVRWNLDKRYLRDLAARGVRVVPTVFVEPGQPASLAAIVREHGFAEAVVKPAVSGGAYRTHRFLAHQAESLQPALDEILTATAALVQPFFPEIAAEGEWSFFFFGGTFTHAVLKVPTAKDYRVQPEFGGTFRRMHPESSLLAQARAALDALPEAPAYARIDGVRRGADLYLMEAELVEPYLFLAAAPEAAGAYVRVVADLARAGR